VTLVLCLSLFDTRLEKNVEPFIPNHDFEKYKKYYYHHFIHILAYLSALNVFWW
jgi:hypothetical protein